MNEKLTYLSVNFFTIIFPFIFSFDKKIRFYRKWKCAFTAILISGLFFLVWDNIFTFKGVWYFNHQYTIGIRIFKLPIEEILFFVTVPYASLFVYEAVKYYFPDSVSEKISRLLLYVIIGFFIVLSLLYHERLYTFFVAIFLVLGLFASIILFNNKTLGYIFISYTLLTIPFLIVNGILTGSFLHRPIVLYNNYENLGIKIMTIPIEDAFYSLLMLILSVAIYEKIQPSQKNSASN